MAVLDGTALGDDDDAVPHAKTGLDFLLSSLALENIARFTPDTIPLPKEAAPTVLSPPDAAEAMDEEPTVGSAPQHVVKPPATAAARNVRLKQATLSFGKTSATAVVENNVAGPSETPLGLRTTTHIEHRYVDCGDDFGGGVSERLSPFIARHGPGGNREVTVSGVDADGQPTSFEFVLYEDDMAEFEGPATHDGCVEVCTAFAEKIVYSRLGDLEGMAGAKLFTPDEYPLDRGERNARCLQWLSSLVTLFKAEQSEEILPGKLSPTVTVLISCQYGCL
ncbi:unnamed protein product [Closterium sp. NIES-64]|nr:unnamed protein product [Closterium sp. NIES-64]